MGTGIHYRCPGTVLPKTGVTVQPSGLHSNKSMHTNCKNRSLAPACFGIALRLQGDASRDK